MTITRADVADLQPGDVVELRYDAYPGTVIRGPVHGSKTGSLSVLFLVIRNADGAPVLGDALTVVSRAPRLYVNHPRTEPRHRDIVLDKDGDAWQRKGNSWYFPGGTAEGANDISDCAPLRLLVDGETGQVIP